MKRILETAVLIMGTLGFWGFVYPELCVTGDAIEADWEDDREVELDLDKPEASLF